MLGSLKALRGYGVAATGDDLGKVVDAYFDDEQWKVLHLVVNVGRRFRRRHVLLPPAAIARVDSIGERIETTLARDELDICRPAETRPPVSRVMEARYKRLYGCHSHMVSATDGGVPAFGALPTEANEALVRRATAAVEAQQQVLNAAPVRTHLRSGREVLGYQADSSRGPVGRVADLFYDQASWQIRYLLVKVGRWPRANRVLVPAQHIGDVSWTRARVFVGGAQAAVRRPNR